MFHPATFPLSTLLFLLFQRVLTSNFGPKGISPAYALFSAAPDNCSHFFVLLIGCSVFLDCDHAVGPVCHVAEWPAVRHDVLPESSSLPVHAFHAVTPRANPADADSPAV